MDGGRCGGEPCLFLTRGNFLGVGGCVGGGRSGGWFLKWVEDCWGLYLSG